MTSTQIPKINDMEREPDSSPTSGPLPSDRKLMEDVYQKVSVLYFKKRNDAVQNSG